MIPSDTWTMLQSDLVAACNVRPGWDGCGAPAPNKTARTLSMQLLREMHKEGLIPCRIAPCSEGGVNITITSRPQTVGVEVYNDGAGVAVRYEALTDKPEMYSFNAGKQGFSGVVQWLLEQVGRAPASIFIEENGND